MLICACDLTGCRHHNQAPSSEIRFVDAVPGVDEVTVSVKGGPEFDDGQFGALTGFENVPAGSFLLQGRAIRKGNRIADIIPANVTLEPQQLYTALAVGQAGFSSGLHLLVFPDDMDAEVPPGNAQVRVIDAYPHSPKVDLAINNIVAFSGLSCGVRSKPILIPAKSYVWKAFTEDNYANPIDGPATFALESGRAYELIVLDPQPAKPGLLFFLDDLDRP